MTLSSHALRSVQVFLRGSHTLFSSQIMLVQDVYMRVFGCSHLKLVSKVVSPRCLTYMSHQNLSEGGVKKQPKWLAQVFNLQIFFVLHELHLNPTSHMFSVSFL